MCRGACEKYKQKEKGNGKKVKKEKHNDTKNISGQEEKARRENTTWGFPVVAKVLYACSTFPQKK